jgi:Polyketide cyclase / dehydrase and lipid transport
MAGPIAGALAILGGMLGYFVQRRPWRRVSPASTLLAVFAVPSLLMGAEEAVRPEAPLVEVRTTVEIDASPETVWAHVVSFSELPAPTEWIFRIGIAYPIRATIEGRGAGAIRRCEFSTGAFLEPIEVWDEPRRLAFSVDAQPAPMAEWTPYAALRPPHLDGYLRSERGEFRISPLGARGTRLEGTTWYRHDLWPAAYWRLWSDAIIHRIHGRVLRHIKALAETRTTRVEPS